MPEAIGSNLQPMSIEPNECDSNEPTAPVSTAPTAPTAPKDEVVNAPAEQNYCADWFSDAGHLGGFPTSEGFPIYRQSDGEWGDQKLGEANSKTISQAGCAMTATAMAMSGMTGKTITPSAVDDYMKSHGGMNGSSLDWTKIGGAANPPIHVDRKTLTANEMLVNARDGKPVVFAINHSGGSSDQHWLVATGLAPDGKGITATDPATGKVLTFEPNAAGKYECANAPYPGGARDYVMTGSAAVFTRA